MRGIVRDEIEDDFEWDPAKCARNIERHAIDFADAAGIWSGMVLQLRSDRDGEERHVAYGRMEGRLIAVVWTPRAGRRRIISVRRANRHERDLFAAALAGHAQDRD